MILTGSFAGEYEIINAAELLNLNIVIYTNLNYSNSDDKFEFQFENLYTKKNSKLNPFIPTILIGYVNSNHFVSIMPKTITPEEIPVELNIITINKKNTNKAYCKIEEETIINNNIEQNNKEDIINNNKLSINNRKDIKSMDIKFKEFLSNYVKNEISIYPKLNGMSNGDTKLENIYNFNKKKKIIIIRKNGQHILKMPLLEIKILKRNIRNYIFYQKKKKIKEKKGRTEYPLEYKENELINIKSLKNEFRKSTKNIFFLKITNFYIKKIKQINPNSKKINYIEELYKVPTVSELNKFLYKFHIENAHCNSKDTNHFFDINKIGFYGLNIIINDYISNCPVCVQYSKTVHRVDPLKTIKVEGPNIRH